MAENNSTDQKDHRQRLPQRFVETRPGALADYEMLELLLFHAILRRDTKPIAKRLINHFGSYAAGRLARDGIMDRVVLGSWEALMDYLRISMARQETD